MKEKTTNLSDLIEKTREYLETFFDEHFLEISDERLENLIKVRNEKNIEKMINHD